MAAGIIPLRVTITAGKEPVAGTEEAGSLDLASKMGSNTIKRFLLRKENIGVKMRAFFSQRFFGRARTFGTLGIAPVRD